MIARGKRRATRGASPLGHKPNERKTLKERNNYRSYVALSVLSSIDICEPEATRFALLSACPGYQISRLWRCAWPDSEFLRQTPHRSFKTSRITYDENNSLALLRLLNSWLSAAVD